jgi:hypothetical protein
MKIMELTFGYDCYPNSPDAMTLYVAYDENTKSAWRALNDELWIRMAAIENDPKVLALNRLIDYAEKSIVTEKEDIPLNWELDGLSWISCVVNRKCTKEVPMWFDYTIKPVLQSKKPKYAEDIDE